MKRALYAEYYKDKRKEWRWRIKGSNGKVMAVSSEGYINKYSCRNCLTTILSLTPEGIDDDDDF